MEDITSGWGVAARRESRRDISLREESLMMEGERGGRDIPGHLCEC